MSNTSVTEYFTVTALGLPMRLVGQGAAIARGMSDPTASVVGKEWAHDVGSLTLGGGESVDVVIDTTGIAAGTYFLYTTNLNYLSNGNEDRRRDHDPHRDQPQHLMPVREEAMTKLSTSWTAVARLTCAAVTICAMSGAMAKVEGVTGTAFTLVAKSGYISIADGASIYNWGYALRNADGSANFQYPGPTLIVNQGDVVEITLINELPTNVSLLFPGQIDITTAQISNADAPSGCTASGNANKTDVGRITVEARPRGCLKYRFVASRPGTYTYHSGTQMPVQLEMGLFGALIVRPKDAPGQAYEHAGTRFDREHLMMLSEVDPVWHEAIRAQAEAVQLPNQNGSFRWYVNMSGFATRNPLYWFINGRTGPDTMNGSFVPELPAQPYNALPRMHPGERLLVRTINAGRDLHPFHHHGNNTWTLGVDGRMLASGPATGPDLARSDNTLRMVPGQTVDAIYEWTGKGLNWDAYGVGRWSYLQRSQH